MEARRLDRLEDVISRAATAGVGNKTLSYALRVTQQLVINRDFRQQVGDLYVCFILLQEQ